VRFANPAGLWLLLLAVPVLLLHVLRPRRQPRQVASTFLWQSVTTPVSAASPWRKLKPSLLLLVQLLVVALLALSVAGPVRITPAPLAQHTVFIIDASGSMLATDGRPDSRPDVRESSRTLGNLLSDFNFNQPPRPPEILSGAPQTTLGPPTSGVTVQCSATPAALY